MNNHHRCFALFGNAKCTVAKFLKLTGFGYPTFGIYSYGANTVFEEFGGFVNGFKCLSVIFAVDGKASSFMQILVCNGIAVIFFSADKGYVITLQKHNGNGRIKPGDMVADKKEPSVLWNMLAAGDLDSYMHYSQKESGSFHKDSVEKAILSVDGLIQAYKKREESAYHNVNEYA